jgi:hypothetical protein
MREGRVHPSAGETRRLGLLSTVQQLLQGNDQLKPLHGIEKQAEKIMVN